MTDIMRQRVHVSVAIEGNTNSSFLTDLGQIYGQDQVLIYRQSTKKFIRLSQLPHNPAQTLLKLGRDLLGNTPLFNRNSNNPDHLQDQEWFGRGELPPDIAAVHGYYSPGIFKGVFENPFISIILKDPIERMISLYQDWSSPKNDLDWRVSIPYSKVIDFREFALQDIFSNFQSKCLGSRRLGDFVVRVMHVCLVRVSHACMLYIMQASIQDRFGLLSLIAIGTANMAVAGTIRSFPKEKAIVSNEMASKLYRTLPYVYVDVMC